MKIKKLLSTLAIVTVVLFAGCRYDDYVAIDGGPCPVVVSVTPTNGQLMVGRSNVNASELAMRTTLVTATFNKKIDPTTINETTFIVKVTGGSEVPGNVTYVVSDSTAVFTASSKFPDNTTYEARVTTGVKDLMGNALQEDYVWAFSTGTTILPVVLSTDPLNLDGGVALNKVISATFNVPMDGSTLTSAFTLMNGTVAVSGSVSTVGAKVSFTPSAALNPGTVYTAKITTASTNLDGSVLAKDTIWKFTTIIEYSLNVISTNGTVSKNPSALTYSSGTDVVLTPTAATGYSFSSWSGDATGTKNPLTVNMNSSKNITANFTLNSSNFSLNTSALNGTVVRNPDQLTYANGTSVELTAVADNGFIFNSWNGDALGTNSLVTIVMDANKNVTANFDAAVVQGPGIVNLGTSTTFTILSKTGISTIGVTSITGNIGVSPATATAITGFSLIMDATNQFSTSLYVSGHVFAADYTLAPPSKMITAISDVENAFTTAMGMTTSVIVDKGAGNISGMTLVPGLYKWSSGLLITNAGVTLSGGPNDTWVFQIAQGLTVNNTAIIHLTGGAQAKNVFWITASEASIGSNVDFSGNILSQTLISLNTGAKVTGRLLAQSAVTLNTATVVLP